MCKLLYEVSCLKSDTGRITKEIKTCDLCTNGQIEDVVHMLFECEQLNVTRKALWQKLLVVLPAAMSEELSYMSSTEKTIFIFSAFQCPYVIEWQCVYENVLSFVHTMYNTRRQIISSW